MPARNPSIDDQMRDTLLRIEIHPPLPCGIAGCEELARRASVERDARYTSLWRLLPICETHQVSLAAGASASASHQQFDGAPRE
ncbi:MAG TPA: hypothetical protein VF808_06755 [Ktedonobacterales bacterium]